MVILRRDVNRVRTSFSAGEGDDAALPLHAVLHKRNKRHLIGCEVWTTRFVVATADEVCYYRSRGKHTWDGEPAQRLPLGSLVARGRSRGRVECPRRRSAARRVWERWVEALSPHSKRARRCATLCIYSNTRKLDPEQPKV